MAVAVCVCVCHAVVLFLTMTTKSSRHSLTHVAPYPTLPLPSGVCQCGRVSGPGPEPSGAHQGQPQTVDAGLCAVRWGLIL